MLRIAPVHEERRDVLEVLGERLARPAAVDVGDEREELAVPDVDLLEQVLELAFERLLADARLVEDLAPVLRPERLEQVLLPGVGQQVADRGELGEHAELRRAHVPRQPAHRVQRALASCGRSSRAGGPRRRCARARPTGSRRAP